VGERSYLSIGDVLSLLREEFPDITISKIRFLESRGLLIPERTPSGYRKFYEHDVDRLRWILRQQRENFLPLKVIKGRLEGQEPSSEPTPMFDVVAGLDEPPAMEAVYAGHLANGSRDGDPGERAAAEVAATGRSRSAVAAAGPRVSAGAGAITPRPEPTDGRAEEMSQSNAETDGDADGSPGVEGAEPAVAASLSGEAAESTSSEGRLTRAPGRAPARRSTNEAPASGSAHDVSGAPVGTPAGAPDESVDDSRPLAEAGSTSAGVRPLPVSAETPGNRAAAASHRPRSGLDPGSLAGASLTAAELAQASGLDAAQVTELESYGLIASRMVAGVRCYDEDALVVSGLAASFARYGIEARHLRLFKHAAERQASLYSQVVMPLLRQRNPDARRRAHDDLTRLSELGASMQACFGKTALGDLTRG
jgi:DNA-binding transcriptional MerR regulator